jgi:hypothetical protein
MRYLPALTLVGALALVVVPALAIELNDYTVVKLHRGMNNVELGVTGQHATVVVGHRANWNAHSFDVTTIYLSGDSPAAGLDIVGGLGRSKGISVSDDVRGSRLLTP